ncbi:MAG: hypothetical protein MUF79_12755 [Burkholderiales bacterium]|nr:hypothetical protein [Burkholderiales bacterium]
MPSRIDCGRISAPASVHLNVAASGALPSVGRTWEYAASVAATNTA